MYKCYYICTYVMTVECNNIYIPHMDYIQIVNRNIIVVEVVTFDDISIQYQMTKVKSGCNE